MDKTNALHFFPKRTVLERAFSTIINFYKMYDGFATIENTFKDFCLDYHKQKVFEGL